MRNAMQTQKKKGKSGRVTAEAGLFPYMAVYSEMIHTHNTFPFHSCVCYVCYVCPPPNLVVCVCGCVADAQPLR
jgi:hypothetical protein